jgi:hypothetical protein
MAGAGGGAAEALASRLETLEERTERLAELERGLAEARAERADLLAAIGPLMRRLAPAERRAAETRLRAIEARAGPAAVVGRTRVTRAALAFLSETQADEIRAAELTWYLRRMGFAVVLQYAATLLRDRVGRGVVSRRGHGIYRINRVHPAILRLRAARAEGLAAGL